MSENPKINQLFWRVAAPVAVAFVIMVIFIAAIALPGSPVRFYHGRLAIVGETLLILMFLCPMVICMFIPIGLLAVTIFYMQKAHIMTQRGLTRVRTLTHSTSERGLQLANDINRKSIGIQTRFAFINKLINVFDRPVTDESLPEGKTSHD